MSELPPEQPGKKQHTPPEKLEPVNRLGSIGLPLALTLCIAVALLLTGISIGLYYNSNLSRIDLSKPKYADIRPDLVPGEEGSNQEEYDTDSPLTREAVQEAVKELRQRREDLRALGNFDSSILEDAQLGIGTGRQ